MKALYIKWKKWVLPTKISVIGSFVGIVSLCYVLIPDVLAVIETKTWNEHYAVMANLSSKKDYVSLREYIDSAPDDESISDLIGYYEARYSVYATLDLGGRKAERLLRKIKPDSPLYIKAQALRMHNSFEHNGGNEIVNKIMADMEVHNSKNYYYYLLKLLPLKRESYNDLKLTKSEIDKYYSDAKFGNKNDIQILSPNSSVMSLDLEEFFFRDLVYYFQYMRMAAAAKLECNSEHKNLRDKAQKLFTNNNSFELVISKIGMKSSMLVVLQSIYDSSNETC